MAAYLDAKYIKTSTPKGSSRAERELIDQGNRDMNLQRINEKAAMSLAAGIRPGYDKEEVLFKFTSEQYAIGVSNPIGTQLKKHPDRRKLKKRYSNAPN